jgi:hypothetical protein
VQALAAVLAFLSLTLAGCQHAQPPASKPAPAPVVEAPPPPTHREAIRALWTFRAGESACTAIASGGHMGLTAIVRRTGSMHLSVALPAAAAARLGRTVPVQFTGPAGNWQLRGARARRSVEISLPLDDVALSRVLVLLSGGTLAVGDINQRVPSLRLPAAGDAGRHWFECTRDQLI